MHEQLDYIEELMLASLGGRISENDQEFLDEMISGDPAVAELWSQHVLIAGHLKHSVRKQVAWERIKKEISADPVKNKIKSPVRNVSLAFTVILLVIGGIYFFRQTSSDSSAVHNAENQEYLTFSFEGSTLPITADVMRTGIATIETKNGELYFRPKTATSTVCSLKVPRKRDTRIVLADGTKIWMNAASELSFPLVFDGQSRQVSLTGEAYFEVTHKDGQPFIVSAGGVKVEVKGTHFNIRAYPDEQIVTSLTQGSVSVVAGKQNRLLVPGEMATFDSEGLRTGSFDSSKVLTWKKGIYRFNNERLDEINPVFDRWFGYTFHYADQSLKTIRFSGFMDKQQPLDSFLNRLCQSANLQYVFDRTNINLSRK